jgi:hypothetical protein
MSLHPELLLTTYRGGLQKHESDLQSFRVTWWNMVDQILPELAPEQRCFAKMLYGNIRNIMM